MLSHRYDSIQKALTASAARFLHSPTHRVSLLLPHQAQIRPVEMTKTARATFDEPEQPMQPKKLVPTYNFIEKSPSYVV